jgi:hypothetical protein
MAGQSGGRGVGKMSSEGWHERVQALKKRDSRLDYEIVLAEAAYAIIDEVVRPADSGFVVAGRASWARREDEEHVSLLHYERAKGHRCPLDRRHGGELCAVQAAAQARLVTNSA